MFDSRTKIMEKITLLNQKSETELEALRTKMFKNDEHTLNLAFDKSTTDFNKALEKQKIDLLNMIEERFKRQQSTLSKELDLKLKKQMKAALEVPDMIGEGCRFSTFANFITQFHYQTTKDILLNKTAISAHDSRLSELDSTWKIYKGELDNLH